MNQVRFSSVVLGLSLVVKIEWQRTEGRKGGQEPEMDDQTYMELKLNRRRQQQLRREEEEVCMRACLHSSATDS